jgi:hypothetical protein
MGVEVAEAGRMSAARFEISMNSTSRKKQLQQKKP